MFAFSTPSFLLGWCAIHRRLIGPISTLWDWGYVRGNGVYDPYEWYFGFCLKKKKKNGFVLIICRTMKITGSYFFSLNQECLRDSAMTLDFSESVQSFSWEAWGKVVDCCTFSLKWGWLFFSPISFISRIQCSITEAFESSCGHLCWRTGL